MLELWVQTASVPLDPPGPLPLGGYTARGGRLEDPGPNPLRAQSVIFRSGSRRLAIISVEMLTVPESLVAAVKSRLPKDVDLMLLATHTHGAPDSQMLNERMTLSLPGIANYRPNLLPWYAERIAQSVLSAGKESKVAFIDTLRSYRPLNRGRRVGAIPDRMVTQLRINQTPVALSYAAHATLNGPDVNVRNGDWPGTLPMAVWPGAIGDVSPAAPNVQEMGRKLTINPWVTVPIWRPGDRIQWTSTAISLDHPTPHPEFARANRIPSSLAQSLTRRFAPTEASVSAVALGRMAVVGIPGEPTAEVGRKIQAFGQEAGFNLTLVLSHVNGWIGYILTEPDYHRGGYEAQLAMHGPQTGDRVLEAARIALAKVSQP